MNRAITGAWAARGGSGAPGSGSGSGGGGGAGGGAGGGGSSMRRNKISLNQLPAAPASPRAAAEDASATGMCPAASTESKVEDGLPPANGAHAIHAPIEHLPPGSAAAAAAMREAEAAAAAAALQQGASGSSTPAPEGAEGDGTHGRQKPNAMFGAGTGDIQGANGDEYVNNAAAKRKARLTSTSTTSPASPASTKRRRPVGSAKDTQAGSNKAGASSSAGLTNVVQPTARLKDLGGVTSALDQILELIAMPLCHPEIYAHTGVKPPRGVLLHGPPGCGKTMLAGALAGELNVPLLSISSPSIVSGTSGESEQTLRRLFEEAVQMAPCILFLDEIDSITPKRESASREMERRIVAQLLTLLDDLTWDKTEGKPVMVIGATNRPDALDPALRRAGRFDHEIALGVPDEAGREEILRILCGGLRLAGDFDLRALAKATPGYVGADLVALTAAAGIRAVKRIFSELAEESIDIVMGEDLNAVEATTDSDGVADGSGTLRAANGTLRSKPCREASIEPGRAMPSATLFEALPPALQGSAIATFLRCHQAPLSATELERLQIGPQDFLSALPSIQPSSKREGFATVPEVTWADIGALEATREELEMSIVEPIKDPDLFRSVGVVNSGGVLLWGPPGCGKTLLAKAVANESGANFISVKGPELLNKYVGESERAVRQVFARARTSSPCVIFFDELDALVPRRDDSLSESSSRVVNTLLTELDGLEARVQTYVIGATNRPDMIDPAMCRPGRLDKLLYVDLPSTSERVMILQTLTQKTPLRQEESAAVTGGSQQAGYEWIRIIAEDARCDGFSGADLAALVREASVLALREQVRQRKRATDASSPNNVNTLTAHQQHNGPASFTVRHSGAPLDTGIQVGSAHFAQALDKVQPSVGVAQRKKYAALRSRLSGLPGGAGGNGGAPGQRPASTSGADSDQPHSGSTQAADRRTDDHGDGRLAT